MLESKTIEERPWCRQTLRVPYEDGSLFAQPALPDAAHLARENHSELDAADTNLQGRTLQQLRDWSRTQIIAAARQHTSRLIGEDVPETECELVFVGGHQPSLFHPGVWVKNFAIGELASQTGGVSLNLTIDNDTVSTSRIRIPAGDRFHPRIETIAFDEDRTTAPWEEATVADTAKFKTFGHRLQKQMSGWNIEPLAGELWPDAVGYLKESQNLGECLTSARLKLERRWGLENLELPISQLCRLDPFLWFTSHILVHLPRFRETYNQVLAEYRQVNRIRSHTHPVPELKELDGWLEAPFWVWSGDDPNRRRVYAKQLDREVHLSDGRDVFARLPLTVEMDACCAVEVLRELPAKGIRFRTRALTTTLFARLGLADLFVHGIGGAKYDEMTDRIIARFFQVSAPSFLTLSATQHLPLAEPFDVSPSDAIRLRSLLRDMKYNFDRHFTNDIEDETANLIAEKRKLMQQQQASENSGLSRRERRLQSRSNHLRFQRFQEIARRLSETTRDLQRVIEEDLARDETLLEANAVLNDREFSFCLYPAEKLRDFMTRLWST